MRGGAVWAPCRRTCDFGERRGSSRCARAPATGDHRWSRWPTERRLRRPLDDDATVLPDPRSRGPPDGVRERRGSTTPPCSRGGDDRGPVAPWPSRCSTSCTSAPSRRRVPSTQRSSELDHLVDLGVTHVELHAGRRVRGPTAGVRRRAWSRRTRVATAGPSGLPTPRRRLPRAVASASSSTSSTTTSVPSGAASPSSGRTSADRCRTPWGAPVNLDGPGLRRGAPLHPRQRRDVAARLSTSTASVSTPCTRSSTPRRPPPRSRRSPRAVEPRSARASAAHPVTIAESTSTIRVVVAPREARRLSARRPVERRLPPRPPRRR